MSAQLGNAQLGNIQLGVDQPFEGKTLSPSFLDAGWVGLDATSELSSEATEDFAEVQLPPDISAGAIGGPSFLTLITVTKEGKEQRHVLWAVAVHKWNISHLDRQISQAEELLAFFAARRADLQGFRFKDWTDFEATDEVLAVTGADTVQLVRTYSFGGEKYVRNIYKPVSSPAVTMKRNAGSFAGFSIDYKSGTAFLTPDISKLISNITQAVTPTVTTTTAHGFAVGDKIWIKNVNGMTQINDRVVTVLSTPLTTTFTIDVDTSAFNAYASAGEAEKHVQPSETLSWTGEFDVPVRFNIGQMELVQSDLLERAWSVPIIEVLKPPTPVRP